MLFLIATVLVFLFIGPPALKHMKEKPYMVIVYFPVAVVLMVVSIAASITALESSGMDKVLYQFAVDVGVVLEENVIKPFFNLFSHLTIYR